RIIYIQMNVKKRLLKLHWIQFPVKRIVIFFFQLRGLLCPRWIWIVDYIVNFLRWRLVFFFCIFGFWKCFRPHSKFNWNRHKLVVLNQKFANTAFFQKLCGIFSDVKYYLGSAFFFVGFFQCEFRRTIANPMYGWFVFIAF